MLSCLMPFKNIGFRVLLSPVIAPCYVLYSNNQTTVTSSKNHHQSKFTNNEANVSFKYY